ncbi:MAG: hypothetical protein ACOC5T_07495 [Elusimicrobiota bacterium]
MKIKIVAVIWNDVFEYEEENLDDENFELAPTLQTGLLYDEDDEKIRLIHAYSLNCDEHDFIVIPKSLIVKKILLGFFDTETEEITIEK